MKFFPRLILAILTMIFFLLSACAPTTGSQDLLWVGEVSYPAANVVLTKVTADEAIGHPSGLYEGDDGDIIIYYVMNDLIRLQSGESTLIVARVDTYQETDFTGFLVGNPPTYFKVRGPAGTIGRLMQELCKSTAEAENLGQNCY